MCFMFYRSLRLASKNPPNFGLKSIWRKYKVVDHPHSFSLRSHDDNLPVLFYDLTIKKTISKMTSRNQNTLKCVNRQQSIDATSIRSIQKVKSIDKTNDIHKLQLGTEMRFRSIRLNNNALYYQRRVGFWCLSSMKRCCFFLSPSVSVVVVLMLQPMLIALDRMGYFRINIFKQSG